MMKKIALLILILLMTGRVNAQVVAQGAPGAAVDAWWLLLTDASQNGPVAVKPASTAPIATDPALVTGLSPNGNVVRQGAGNPASPWYGVLPPIQYTGSLSGAAQSVGGPVNGNGVCSVEVTDNAYDGGPLAFYATIDLVATPVSGMNAVTGAVASGPSIDSAMWLVPCASYATFQVFSTTYTSGSVDIEIGMGHGSVNPPTGTQAVSAVDLDIRNLAFATDKVDASGSTGVGVTGTFFQATQPVSAVSLPLPAGAATSALQTQPGVDIGDVTVNNAAGGAAVNIQDGGNSITVDGPLTDAQLRATPVPVSGTVAVSTTAFGITQTASNNDVDVLTLPSVTIGTFPDNEPFNVAQFGGAAVVTGIGASGAGIPRVTAAMDPVTANAPFAASVGVASAQCLASNASRKAAFFVNTSTAIISLAESGLTAVLNSGITLEPGAAYNMLPPFLTTGAVNCIASAAASNLSGLEKQ
jgi:hypothetical protein